MLYFISYTDEFNTYICVLEKKQLTWKVSVFGHWSYAYCITLLCLSFSSVSALRETEELIYISQRMKLSFFSQMNSLDSNQLWNLLDVNTDFLW